MPPCPKTAAASPPSQQSNPMDPQRLASMANQIVRNFAALGDDHAAEATAEHIKDYWDPRMRATLLLRETTSALDPVARRAAELLRAAE